jgi:hypothetical protein
MCTNLYTLDAIFNSIDYKVIILCRNETHKQIRFHLQLKVGGSTLSHYSAKVGGFTLSHYSLPVLFSHYSA